MLLVTPCPTCVQAVSTRKPQPRSPIFAGVLLSSIEHSNTADRLAALESMVIKEPGLPSIEPGGIQ